MTTAYKLRPRKQVNPAQTTTLLDYFTNYVSLYKQGAISPVTLQHYKTAANYIKTNYASLMMRDITPSIYQQMLNKYAIDHSYHTVRDLRMAIGQCLRHAYIESIYTVDITKGAVIKGIRKPPKASTNYLNYSDYKQLVKLVQQRLDPSKPSYLMILVIALTGLRYGEAAALTWADIDYNNKVVKVNKSWQHKLAGRGLGPLKTLGSARVVDIDKHTLDLLSHYKHQQQEYINTLAGDNQRYYYTNDNDFIFFSNVNKVVTNRSVNRTLKRVQKQLRIEQPITLHGLRHTYASVLLYQGIDIYTISRLLGHSDEATTRSTYLHVIQELKDKNRQQVHGILSAVYQ
jgi:integrase